MRISIRWKLMASYLLLIVITGGAHLAYFAHSIHDRMITETREALLRQGRLARLSASREIHDLRRDSPAVAAAVAAEVNSRVTIISGTGEVVGDSEIARQDVKDMENHLSRPEIRQALTQGAGVAIRHSSTVKASMMYAAYPFVDAAGDTAVIRIALPLASIEKTRSDYLAAAGVSLAVSFAVAAILSYLLSNITSRSLRRIASVATQLARGDFRRRIRIPQGDEVGQLAAVLNEMAGKIEMQVSSLSAEKARLDTILRGMGEGLLVADAAGVVTLVNPAFSRMFGLGSNVEGKSLIDLTRHPGLHVSFRYVIETAAERFEELVLGAAEERILLTHWVPLLEEGEVHGVVAVFNDISDLKKLERMRRDFVANVSHELRTPITIIKGYAETLLSGAVSEDPDRAGRFIEIIHTHSERLGALVADLLALSELESGGVALDVSEVELASLVQKAVLLLEEKAATKRIEVTADTAGGHRVLADVARLEQVFVNLLDNAIKYTPEGGAVRIVSAAEGDSVRISFIDNGIGIPPKDLPRVFERFYRADPARSRDQGGTGLGLAIVKHLVQLQGGSVQVESSMGKGSTFTVVLPGSAPLIR